MEPRPQPRRNQGGIEQSAVDGRAKRDFHAGRIDHTQGFRRDTERGAGSRIRKLRIRNKRHASGGQGISAGRARHGR